MLGMYKCHIFLFKNLFYFCRHEASKELMIYFLRKMARHSFILFTSFTCPLVLFHPNIILPNRQVFSHVHAKPIFVRPSKLKTFFSFSIKFMKATFEIGQLVKIPPIWQASFADPSQPAAAILAQNKLNITKKNTMYPNTLWQGHTAMLH